MRKNGVVVEDAPQCLSRMLTHSVYFAEVDLWIPLSLEGIISYIQTRLPTERELKQCMHIMTLTHKTLRDKRIHCRVGRRGITQCKRGWRSSNATDLCTVTQLRNCSRVFSGVNSTLVDGKFVQGLVHSVCVSTTQSTQRHPEVRVHEVKVHGLA
jgi:hypothetical protein